MIRYLAAAALVLAIAAPAEADNRVTVMTYGAGHADNCASWIASRRNNTLHQYSIVQWTEGFLTAYNVANNVYDILGAEQHNPGDMIAAYFDSYCLARPLNTIPNAVQQIIEDQINSATNRALSSSR